MKLINRYFMSYIVFSACIPMNRPVMAQEKIPQQFVVFGQLPAAQFEKWVYEQAIASDSDVNKADANAVASLVLKRIAEDRSLTDKTILFSVGIWRNTEDYITIALQQKDKTAKFSHVKTRAYIDQLLPHVQDRPFLVGKILTVKAETYSLEDDRDNVTKVYRENTKLLTEFRQEVDAVRLKAFYDLGNSLFYAVKDPEKDKEEARIAYARAGSYPFWEIEGNPELSQKMRLLYADAALRLIELYRGDLMQLERFRTYFVPSVMNIVGPPLARAIQAAGGKVDPAELVEEVPPNWAFGTDEPAK